MCIIWTSQWTTPITCVAPPTLFPPLSLFMLPKDINYESLDPHAEEDVRLVVHAQVQFDEDMLPKLKLSQWTDAFPHLDALKRVRLLGVWACAS